MRTIRIDDKPENQDWLKRTWDLPAYKSTEFLEMFPDLDHFRTLPVYKFAEEQGLILDDEWMGVPDRRDGARLKAVTPKTNGGK